MAASSAGSLPEYAAMTPEMTLLLLADASKALTTTAVASALHILLWQDNITITRCNKVPNNKQQHEKASDLQREDCACAGY